MLTLSFLGIALLAYLEIRVFRWLLTTTYAKKAKAERAENGVPVWLENGFFNFLFASLWLMSVACLMVGAIAFFK